MLKQDSNDSVRSVGNRPHFNKELIRQIVKSVERGATRREVINRYRMTKSTLSEWMREYGSPSYHASQRPLTVTERRSMVRGIEEGGMTISEAKLAFNLMSTDTVKKYMRDESVDCNWSILERISSNGLMVCITVVFNCD